MRGMSLSRRWIYLKEKIDTPYNAPEGLDGALFRKNHLSHCKDFRSEG
jgi:hypothetical protein